EIIGRGTEAARRDHGARAIERFPHGARDVGRRVANRRTTHDLHTDRGEFAREVRRVRVDRETEQKFITDGDDFDRRAWTRRIRHYGDGEVAKMLPNSRRYSTKAYRVSTT